MIPFISLDFDVESECGGASILNVQLLMGSHDWLEAQLKI
jgi:hypothetical protein